MFRASLDNPKIWKQIVDAIATLLTEAHFKVTPAGLFLAQYDSARAAKIDLFIPANNFLDYQCVGEHDVCIGVDDLVKVSRRIAADDSLDFDLNTNMMRLEIRMRGQATRTFKLNLLTPPDDQEERLAGDFDVVAEMASDAMKQAVKDIGVVSDHMIITAMDDRITFSGSGDTGEVESELRSGGEDSLLFSLRAQQSRSMYALSYLSEISKAISSDKLTLMMNSGRPAMFQFGIADTGEIKFLLAPRRQRV
jgi:proliferating cell nuclear antigen